MKTIIIFLIITICAASSIAQIRHVPGVKSVDVVYGVSGHGTVMGAYFVSYWRPNLYMKTGAFLENGNESGISYQSIGADFKVARTLLKKSPVFYLNGTAGVMLSVDKTTAGDEFFKIDQAFKYGPLAGIEMELFITDAIVLVTSFDQRFLIGTEFGNFRWFANAGLRFNF